MRLEVDSISKLCGVEYLRGLAALSVVFCHVTNGNPAFLPASLIKQIGSYGYLGVDVFFVLSGFIIPYSLDARGYEIWRDGRTFFLRRLVRIEPPYLVSTALSILLIFGAAATPWFRGEIPDDLLYSAVLHPLYLVPWMGGHWLNPVFWTLAIEFQYYIFILFLAPLLLSERPLLARCALAVTGLLSLLSPDLRLLFHYLPLFGMGFLAFLCMRRILGATEFATWLFILGILTLHNMAVPELIAGWFALTGVMVIWPNSSTLSFLGSISYSLYLTHTLIGMRIVNMGSRISNIAILDFGVIVAATAASILFAYAFYLCIERPAIQAAKRVGRATLTL